MSNQIVISSGAKLRGLNGVITGTTGVLDSVPLGAANGVATLDSSGKVPVSQLPSSVVTYLGTWNAATNTPTLANGTGDAGDMYICNVAGTVNFGAGPITFAVGDWVLYGSGTWQKSNGQNGTVTSVAVTESGDALNITGSPITTSGTINIGFAGTSAQYVAGDGSLITFPSVITEAQNLITEVYNETGATLTKGTVVYINGGHGNLPTITKAIATSDATSAQTYGVVRADITNNNNGYVTVVGRLGDLDTQAYSNGTQLYLSSTTAGAWTSTKQYAPAHLVYVGIVVRSHPTQGVVEVKIQNGYELDELHDVSAQTPSNNDGLFYNSSNSLWENKSIATALGYTPANDSLVVHLAGTETITGAKTFSATLTAASVALFNNGILLKDGASSVSSGHFSLSSLNATTLGFLASGGRAFDLIMPSSGGAITVPNGSGTLALTSNLSAYVPYTGATTDVNLGTWALFSAGVQVTNGGAGVISTDGWLTASKGIFLTDTASGGNWTTGTTNITARTAGLLITHNLGGGILNFNTSTTYTYTFPSADGTIALTSNLSAYLPLTGGTLTGALNGTSATFTSSIYSSGGDLGIGTTSPETFAGYRTAEISATAGGIVFAKSTTGSITTQLVADNGTSSGYVGTRTNHAFSIRTNNSDKLTLASTGAATFSSSVTASGIKPQLVASGGASSGAGIALNTGLSGTDRRNWFVGTEENVAGDFVIKCSTAAGLNGIDGNTRLAILNNGNVGIGTSSPDAQLVINGSSNSRFNMRAGDTRYGTLYADSGVFAMASITSIPLVFGINDVEKMRISTAGNVGIGTSTFNGNNLLQVAGRVDVNLDQGAFRLFNGSNTFIGGIGTGAWVDGTSTTDIGLYSINTLRFYSGGSSSERMRITSGGSVLINTSSNPYESTYKFIVKNTTNQNIGFGLQEGELSIEAFNDAINSPRAMRLYANKFSMLGGNVLIGTTSDNGYKNQIIASAYGLYISAGSTSSHYPLNIENSSFTALFRVRADGLIMTGTNTLSPYNFTTGTGANMVVDSSGYLYRSTSSLKYKTNVTDYDKGLDIINKIRPVYYNSKNNGDTLFAGLIAEDIHELGLTEFVQYAEDGSPDALSYSNMVALLIKGIQELKQEIDELKNK